LSENSPNLVTLFLTDNHDISAAIVNINPCGINSTRRRRKTKT
jgi:hypothetical protein